MRQSILRKNIVLIFGISILLVGLFVLVSWITNIQVLKSFIPSQAAMKANTAIGMVLCGLSLIYLSSGVRSIFLNFAVVVQSLIVLAIAILTLLEYLLQFNFGIDQILFKNINNIFNLRQMSPTTAFCFLNISVAIILSLPAKKVYLKKPIVVALGTTIIIISGLAFLSYIPKLLFNYPIFNYVNMDIHTALMFILLGASLLILTKEEGGFGWELNASITTGSIVWLLSLLIISLAYYNFINQLKQSNEEAIKTQKVMSSLSRVLINLGFFDINKNNYLITGDKIYLANKIINQKELYEFLDNANQLIKENSKQEVLLNQLKSLVIEKINLSKNIAEETSIKDQALKEKILNNKALVILNQLQTKEDKILIFQEAKQNTLLNRALLLSPLGILLSITMLSIGLFILNFNILDRKKIRANQKRLAEIVESSGDGIISEDLNNVITSWNAGAERIFGYTAEEMIGQSILTLIPTDRVSEEDEIINKIKNGEGIENFETIRKRKDGRPIEVSITVSLIKNAKNEIIGASKIIRDITEKKLLELQFRQGQKMSAIGQLTGGVAHDFNNLLGIILGNLDLLERGLTDNEELMKRVKNALNAATRGADLTKRLLAFSRLQYLHPTPVRLVDSIMNVVEMAKRILGENIEIITHLDASIPPVMVDASELESALLNLAINARDAMPNGGKLVFSAKLLDLDNNYLSVQAGDIRPGAYACIAVTDTGEGMPPEILEHIFEPFFTTKGRGKGTGMGLSMVYGFIKQSGGVIRVYSEIGYGTTISLYLPFTNNLEIKTEKNKSISLQQKFTEKVLVVDDEAGMLEIASIYLKEMGFAVLHAIDGDGAIAIFEKNPDIALLVTDIIMPGKINGIELATKIRQLKQSIIVVYTSGFSAETLSEKSGKIEEVLINKPYSRELFVTAICQAMNSDRL